MRQEHQRGAETIVGDLVDETAEDSHEAAQLAARLVENPRRTPALRAGHDRVMAVIAFDTGKLAGDEIESALPRYRHERLAAAALAVAGAGAGFEPALAHKRLRDPRFRMHRRGDCLDQGRRIGIALERPHADDAAIFHLGEKSAPMGMIADELGHDAA